MPAKTIDLALTAVSYTVEVTDTCKITDYTKKDTLKTFQEVTSVSDWTRVMAHRIREFTDVIKAVEPKFTKNVTKAITDTTCVVEAAVEVFTGKVVTVQDVVKVTEPKVTKAISKAISETITAVEVKVEKILNKFVTVQDVIKAVEPKFTKIMVKNFTDTVKAVDGLYKQIILTFRDYFVGEHTISKGIGKALRETPKMTDILTKVAFTLCGMDSRRVYFHKVWGDIIEPEDHNTKVDSAKLILDSIKRLNDRLGAPVDQLISEMEDLISKMVKVVKGDYVLTEHVNLLADFVVDAVDATKTLYDKFRDETGKTLPDVEYWIAMADGRTKFIEKRKFGDLVQTKDHNIIVDILKPLELALKKMEEEL